MGALDTEVQLALERTALRALATREVSAAIHEVELLYGADSVGSTRAGQASITSAARSIAVATTQLALAALDPVARLQWVVNAPHSWHGLDVPGSGYGIDNPDNVHRHTYIDPHGRYRITGRSDDWPPGQQSFILYAEQPGFGAVSREGAEILETFVHQPGPQEEFVITVGPEPSDDSRYLCTRGRAAFLIVRDALADWNGQRPVALEVTRVDTDTPVHADCPVPEAESVAEWTAGLLPRLARYWLEWNNTFLYSRPSNLLVPPRPRPFGAACSTSFALEPDEALLVQVDRWDADYLGCQVTDPWGVSRDYVHRTGSLNGSQVDFDLGGIVSYVVAATDPGVVNWLDTSGLGAGLLTVRWQGFAAPAGKDSALVRECRVIKLDDVPTLLSRQEVTPAQRAEQRERRAAEHALRMA